MWSEMKYLFVTNPHFFTTDKAMFNVKDKILVTLHVINLPIMVSINGISRDPLALGASIYAGFIPV